MIKMKESSAIDIDQYLEDLEMFDGSLMSVSSRTKTRSFKFSGELSIGHGSLILINKDMEFQIPFVSISRISINLDNIVIKTTNNELYTINK